MPKMGLVTGASRGIGRAIVLALDRQDTVESVFYHRARQDAGLAVGKFELAGGNDFILRISAERFLRVIAAT